VIYFYEIMIDSSSETIRPPAESTIETQVAVSPSL